MASPLHPVRLSLLAALAAVALSGCGKPGNQPARTAPATSPEPTAASVGGESGRAPIGGDASAKAMLQVLEGNVVALSKQALSRNVSKTVADFAGETIAVHHDADPATAGKGGPGDAGKIAAQVAKEDATRQALQQARKRIAEQLERAQALASARY